MTDSVFRAEVTASRGWQLVVFGYKPYLIFSFYNSAANSIAVICFGKFLNYYLCKFDSPYIKFIVPGRRAV